MNVVQVLAFNSAREPFTDWRVRRALALAVNREEIIEGAAWGHGIPLYSGISPAMDAFFHSGLAEVNPYDPELAKQLLREAGQETYASHWFYRGITPSTCRPVSWPPNSGGQLGVDVDLQIVEWGTWLERVYTQRDYDASIIGLAGRLDPHAILVRYTSGNSRNFFNFSDERYDALISAGLLATGEERRQIYLAAQEILAQQLPGVL